jgi:hypothetical protein
MAPLSSSEVYSPISSISCETQGDEVFSLKSSLISDHTAHGGFTAPHESGFLELKSTRGAPQLRVRGERTCVNPLINLKIRVCYRIRVNRAGLRLSPPRAFPSYRCSQLLHCQLQRQELKLRCSTWTQYIASIRSCLCARLRLRKRPTRKP